MSNATMTTVTVCANGHQGEFPAHLEDEAIALDTDLIFPLDCPCGVALVTVWAGDRVRVMAHGDRTLLEDLAEMGWPERDLGGTSGGPFVVYLMPSLGWNLLARRIKERAVETEGTP